jgi:hypothetical protein
LNYWKVNAETGNKVVAKIDIRKESKVDITVKLGDKGNYTLDFSLENVEGNSREEQIKFELKIVEANYE